MTRNTYKPVASTYRQPFADICGPFEHFEAAEFDASFAEGKRIENE